MSSTSIYKAHIYLWIVALIYGANYSIARIILLPGYIGPNGFILLRIFSGLLLFRIFFGPFIQIRKKDILEILLLSITGVLTNQLFFFNGLARTSPIHASLIMLTTPLLVLLFSYFRKEIDLKLRHWIGSILGFLGTSILVLYSNKNSSSVATWEGDLMILINAISYSIYLSRLPRLMERYPVMEILKWIFAIAFIICIPFGAKEVLNISWIQFEVQHYLSLFFVLIGTTFMAYLFNAKAMEISDPGMVGNYIYLQPLLAIIIAIILGQDHLQAAVVLSAIIIFSGLFLSTSK